MPTNVYFKEEEVVPLLNKMRLPRWVILDLVAKVAGERANVTDDDPPTAVGYESWRWGTRYSREEETLKKLGWVACNKDQLAGIRNDALGIKLVVCNTDRNTGNPAKPPKNLSERGPSACKEIQKNGRQLKMEFMVEEPRDQFWYLCQWFCDAYISIEISRADDEVGGVISNFSDRIIVAKPGEIPGIRRFTVPQDFADVPKPKVARKRP